MDAEKQKCAILKNRIIETEATCLCWESKHITCDGRRIPPLSVDALVKYLTNGTGVMFGQIFRQGHRDVNPLPFNDAERKEILMRLCIK